MRTRVDEGVWTVTHEGDVHIGYLRGDIEAGWHGLFPRWVFGTKLCNYTLITQVSQSSAADQLQSPRYSTLRDKLRSSKSMV